MGRTYRERRVKRKLNNTFSVDYDIDLHTIQLKKWLTLNSWKDDTRINIANFHQAGRGVLFKEKIVQFSKLISIPYHTLVTLNTLEQDGMFRDMFLGCEEKLSTHELFCLYLLWQKHLATKSPWFYYINTIPKSFSVPYFCSEYEKSLLPQYIQKDVQVHFSQINNISLLISKYFNNITCNCCDLKLCEIFNKLDMEWAYFAINTRCVYVDAEIVNTLMVESKNLLNLINDKPSIALAPLLDMFNHNCHVQTEAKLNLNISDITSELGKGHFVKEIVNYDSAVNSVESNDKKYIDLRYELYTLNSFNAYSECFISYGKHGNLKLLTEYGFFVNDNPNDFISINLDEIAEVAKICHIVLAYKKLQFAKEHCLHEQLFIDSDGCSHNLIILLHLFFNPNLEKFDKVYGPLEVLDIRRPIAILIENETIKLKNYIIKMDNITEPSENVSIINAYLKHRLAMLNNAMKKIL